MTTALTLFLSNAASVTISTANQLYTITGNPSTTVARTKLSTSTGYGEILAQPPVGVAWAAGGSIGAQSGKGFFLDAASLSVQQIPGGNWSATLTMNSQQNAVPGGTLIGDFYLRVSKYDGVSTYTTMLTMSLLAQTLTSTSLTMNFSGSLGTATTFASTDFLYIDLWANITTNGNANVNQQIGLQKLSTDTAGKTGSTGGQIVTPGYAPLTSTVSITNAGLNLLRDGLAGATSPTITYVAFGTANTTPQSSDTRLGAEVFRKKVTSYSNGANPGEVFINMYLAPGESVGTSIQEVGFFGGSSATGTANTGVLLARSLYNHIKTNQESIQFQLDFTA